MLSRSRRTALAAVVLFAFAASAAAAPKPARADSAPGSSCLPSNRLDATARPAHGAALVLQICSNGYVVASAQGEHTYRAGDELESGALLSTPPGVTIDFVSSTGNVVRAYSGNTWRIESNAKGDFVTALRGKLDFVVRHALGAFGVYAAPVYGLVPGTEFSVDSQPGTSVSFACSEGRVRLSREVTVHVQAEDRDFTGIRQTEFIAANGPEAPNVRYGLPLPVMTFADLAAARAFVEAQREAALESGDTGTVEDSEFNELRLSEGTPPAIARPIDQVPASTAPSLLPIALGAVAVLAITTTLIRPAPPANPPSTVPGTVHVNAVPFHARAARGLWIGFSL